MVISATTHNRQALDVVLMPLTSVLKRLRDSDSVEISSWKRAGLLRPSVAKPILFSYAQEQVIRKLGRVNRETGTNLRLAVARILGFQLQDPSSSKRP